MSSPPAPFGRKIGTPVDGVRLQEHTKVAPLSVGGLGSLFQVNTNEHARIVVAEMRETARAPIASPEDCDPWCCGWGLGLRL